MRPSYQQKNYAFPLWVVASIYACLSVAKGQTIIHVPAEQPTIQAAINVALNGDTVLVAPGDIQGKHQFQREGYYCHELGRAEGDNHRRRPEW